MYLNLNRKLFHVILFILIANSISITSAHTVEKTRGSQIIETNTFADILKYINPNSLVILDICDTLIEAKQTMGTDKWFLWRIECHKNSGVEPKLASEKALMEWTAVQYLTEVKLTEPGTDKIVQRMQEQGYTVMSLTTRGTSIATRTIQQLKSVNIDLTKSAPFDQEVLFLNPREVQYKNGILFTGGMHKGTCLFKFLELVENVYPKEQITDIVFINDKLSHLSEIKNSCEERNIPFIGLRYGFSDERVRHFSEEIAQYQFEQFGRIISDEEAEKQMSLP